MNVKVARTLDEACERLAENPEAEVLAGGTDFMVEVNYRHRSPKAVVAISAVREIAGWRLENESGGAGGMGADAGRYGTLWIGANMTYTEMATPAFERLLPALTQAARTVGSPQIRNAGTIGGNLGTASPAGDTLPVLAALDAEVLLRSADGSRELALSDFITGPKQTALQQGEIITGVRVPLVAPTDASNDIGRGEFLKVGTRNAMVISVAGLALIARHDIQRVCVGLGSVAAVPVRPTEAEEWISPRLDWQQRSLLDPVDVETFGEMVAQAASPIDDHRSTAVYRRHAVGVMAKRALVRTFESN